MELLIFSIDIDYTQQPQKLRFFKIV